MAHKKQRATAPSKPRATRSDVLWPLVSSPPHFSPDRPPEAWEAQHAGPHYREHGMGGLDWMPGAKPVPRLASHNYASKHRSAGEFLGW